MELLAHQAGPVFQRLLKVQPIAVWIWLNERSQKAGEAEDYEAEDYEAEDYEAEDYEALKR